MADEAMETTAGNGGALLFRLMRSLGAAESGEMRCCDVTTGQGLTLLALGNDGHTTMREVTTALGVSAGTATRVVDNLVRDGLVERTRNPADRRSVCIRPTAKGRERIRDLEECYQRFWQMIFDGIPRNQLTKTFEVLEVLVDAAEKAKGVCCARARKMATKRGR